MKTNIDKSLYKATVSIFNWEQNQVLTEMTKNK